MVGKNFSGKQMSEAFINSAFLALSGGFQDAYTYYTRDEVFSNAQTGNVVLMSQQFMTGDWQIRSRCGINMPDGFTGGRGFCLQRSSYYLS